MKSTIQKSKVKKVNDKNLTINVEVDIDKALGSAHRDQYLNENPHGFRKLNHVHKNKKKYSRKNKKQDFL